MLDKDFGEGREQTFLEHGLPVPPNQALCDAPARAKKPQSAQLRSQSKKNWSEKESGGLESGSKD